MARTNQITKSVGNGEGSLYYCKKLKKWIYQYYYKEKRKTMKQHKGEKPSDFKKCVTKLKRELDTNLYI